MGERVEMRARRKLTVGVDVECGPQCVHMCVQFVFACVCVCDF